jgi:hypothetical protein
MVGSSLNRRRRFAWSVLVALVLGSCSGTATDVGAGVPRRPSNQSSVLVALEQDGGRKATFRLLEDRTLTSLGSGPVDLGYLELAIRSRDGSRVATASAEEPYRSGNTPHTFRVFDVESGTQLLQVENALSPWHGVFAQDAKAIYWLVSTGGQPGTGPGMSLHRLDLETARFAEPIILPPTLMVRDLKALPGGGLAMFGSADDYAGGAFRTTSVGQVFTVSADGEIRSLVLDGINLIDSNPDAQGVPPGREGFDPGLAWDLDRRLLHVVHADSEKVTTVRLESLKAEQGDIVPKRSLASALLSWFIPSATAKELIPFTNRQAFLAPGGEMLFLSGTRMTVEQKSPVVWRQTAVPMGLSVVRTSDMTKVQAVEGGVVNASVSPDGKHVFAEEGGWVTETDDPSPEIAHSRMKILKAADLSLVSEVKPALGQFNGFSADGRTAYLSGCPSGAEEGPGVLTAVDVQTGGAIAQSPIAQCYVNLLMPGD